MLPANENIAEKCHAHTLQCVTAKRIKRRQTTCRTAFRSVKMVFSHFLFPLYKVVSLSSITSRKCIVCSTAEHVSNGYNHSSNVCGFFSLARGKCFNLNFRKEIVEKFVCENLRKVSLFGWNRKIEFGICECTIFVRFEITQFWSALHPLSSRRAIRGKRTKSFALIILQAVFELSLSKSSLCLLSPACD